MSLTKIQYKVIEGLSELAIAKIQKLIEYFSHWNCVRGDRRSKRTIDHENSIKRWYYTILYYTILCYTILYYTTLYYTTLHYIILYYTILYYNILYYTILYYTIIYYTNYNTVEKIKRVIKTKWRWNYTQNQGNNEKTTSSNTTRLNRKQKHFE